MSTSIWSISTQRFMELLRLILKIKDFYMRKITPLLYVVLISLLSCQYENILNTKNNVPESSSSLIPWPIFTLMMRMVIL